MWIREKNSPQEQFLPFSAIFSMYISNLWRQITYLHVYVKFGCSICISSILQIWYVKVPISRSVSEGPLDFEIMRVDCIYIYTDPKGWPFIYD